MSDVLVIDNMRQAPFNALEHDGFSTERGYSMRAYQPNDQKNGTQGGSLDADKGHKIVESYNSLCGLDSRESNQIKHINLAADEDDEDDDQNEKDLEGLNENNNSTNEFIPKINGANLGRTEIPHRRQTNEIVMDNTLISAVLQISSSE